MLKSKTAKVFGVAGLNLLALVSAFVAPQTKAATLNQVKNDNFKVDHLNSASLKSIESSWLKVPVACKARGFNAHPTSDEIKKPSSEILEIYQNLNA